MKLNQHIYSSEIIKVDNIYKGNAYAYCDSLLDQCIAGDFNNQYMLNVHNMTLNKNALKN